MPGFDFETAATYLPHYLNPEARRGLFDQLSGRPLESIQFYDPNDTYQNNVLQGDGWRGFVAIEFATKESKPVSGVVISNSCDIDVRNQSDFPQNVMFAPLIKLSGIRSLLEGGGIAGNALEQKLTEYRKQHVSNVFYLPERANFIEESIVLLDDIHGHPLSDFLRTERSKLFTLTQAAFYIFLIKLSIHFHRINEGIERHIPSAAGAL